MVRKTFLRLGWAAMLVLITAALGISQVNTGTITGIVQDPTNAIIPSAKVQAVNDQTGVTRVVTSNSAGQYVFSFLPIGTYTITVTAKGFETMVQKNLEISAGQTLTADMVLKLGSVKQAVTVSGAPPALNYSSPEQKQTLTTVQLKQLPLPKDDWSSLLGLGNGIAKVGDAVTMNGLAPQAMNLTVDGTNAQADPEVPTLGFYQGFATIQNINTDAIAEVSITKGIAPASVGAGMSGNINIITKSGTNKFHGDLFEINDNSAYDARNQFASTKPYNNFNEFGGAIGGPILKNKLFFFGDFEGVRQSSFSLVSGDVPTPEFVQSTLAVAPEYAPVFAAFPSPNQPYAPGSVTGFYESTGSTSVKDSNADARIDYYPNPNNQLTLRVTRSRPFKFQPRVISVNGRDYVGKNNVYNIQYTHSAGNWTAATRLGYNQMTQNRLDKGFGINLIQVEYGGFNSGGAEDFSIQGGTYTYQEDVAITHGRQTIKFGGVVQRFNDGRIDNTTNTFKYSDLSDFLNNIPSQIQINFPLSRFQLHRYQLGGYLQDDYRVKPNLTLNLGMRYDYFTVPKETNGKLFTRNASPLGPGTGSLRPPSSIYQAYWPDFSPRAGFAWTLGQSRNTVVRGGFGVFFNQHTIFGGPIDDVLDSPYVPFRLTLDRSQALAMGLNLPVDKTSVANTLIANQTPVATTAMDNYFPNPYSMQWTLDVQRQLRHGFVVSVAYVGTRGLHTLLNLAANLPDRLTGVTPDPVLGQFRYYQSADITSYNGLQTSLKRRFANGLQFSVNYTWSRTFAYDDGGLVIQPQPQDNNNWMADHAPTSYDVPNNFNADVYYQLPLARWAGLTSRPAKLLVGGWQVSSIFTAISGTPSNVRNSSSSYPSDRPNLVNGINPYFSNYTSTLVYANAAAFSMVPKASASGAQIMPGDLSYNFLREPGMWNVDLSVGKSFSLTEGVKFRLRGDFFNAFNHTNLGGLQTKINSSSFGRLTSATARTVQIGGRLTF